MHKDLKSCTTGEAVDETWFATHLCYGVAPFVPQVGEIDAAAMA